jgi:hypothetical protein
MPARLLFLAIVAFWLTMNALLWRAEFGAHGDDTPVPLQLVWQKILTAPDASMLSVYENGRRTGFCEFSTAAGQQLATYDADRPLPEGGATHAGYQLHLNGNMAMGEFTNRLKFDGRANFGSLRQLTELDLTLAVRQAAIEIHSLVTNQTVHIKCSDAGTPFLERNLTFADLENPDVLVRSLAGDFADGWFGGIDGLGFLSANGVPKISWSACRTRVKIGTEAVPIYRLETSVLGHPVIVDISTLGEILSVKLPGGITAQIDEWSKS